ncbi:autotransporter domain-containing protein [Mesorhizobium sp. YR577]|uniref:autotransporter domain-containing protein n=1 Tax=Mesorhizobium sp. YR577 TaxID=1884373 RepID=UPI001AECFD40|nr:autotransporter domain-containing protein [Mesorhizobium sp. YR577]
MVPTAFSNFDSGTYWTGISSAALDGIIITRNLTGFDGTTTISAGVLQVGDGGTTGQLGSGDIVNNSALVYNRSDDFTVTNTISGSGTLTKDGAGTLTLSGANTYTGGTTVTAGTVLLGQNNAAGSGGLAVNGTFAMGNYSQAVSSLQGTSSGTVNLGNGILTVDQSINTSFDGNVNSGSIGVLTKQGTGTLTMNGTISGGHVGIEGGTLVLNGANTYGGATLLRNATLIVGNDKALSGSTLTALGPNATLGANKAVTLDNDIILQRAVNGHLTVDTDADLTLSGVVSDTAGAGGTLTKTGSGALILTGANTYGGTTTIKAGVLQVGDGGTTGELGSGDIVNNSQLVFDRSDTFTVANMISGSGTLTKTGEGTMELSGTNGYSGGTTISQGKIAISDDANLGAATGRLILNGGTLGTLADIETDRAISLGASGGSFAPAYWTNLTLDAGIDGVGGLDVVGEGALILTGINSYQGGTTVSDGTLVLGTTVGGSLSGPGGLKTTILGSIVNNGIIDIVNADFTGVTTIKNDDGISFHNHTSASTATITNNGWIMFYDTSSAGNAAIVNSDVVFFGRTSSAGNAVITNDGGVFFIDTSSAGNAIIANNGALGFYDTSSAGNVAITNNGMVVFVGASSAGNATITATDASYGVYFGDHATAGNAALIANGGFFDFSSTYGADGDGVVTAGSIAGTSTGTFFLGENRLIVGGSGASTEFAGEIADEDPMCGCGLTGGSLVKVGAGTLTLLGTSSYTGDTIVSEGRLIVNGSVASSSQITVDAGGYLGGSGTLGTMLVQSGGIIAPGNSIGTLKVNGDLTLAAGSTYQVEIAGTGTSDRIDVSGKATVAGSNVSVMALDPKVSYQNGQTYRILNADDGVSGTFAAPLTQSAFLDLTLDRKAKTVDLTVKIKSTSPEEPEEPEEPGGPPLFGTVADTRNQLATAGALDSLQQSGASLALYNALLVLDAGQARAAFDGLSGEVHASAKTALIEDTVHIRNAANDRIRAAFESVGAAPVPVLAYGPDGQHLAPASSGHGLAVWGNAFGAWGHAGSDGNAARLDHSTGGLLVGGDAMLGDWRLGLLAGYSRTSFDVKDRASSGDSDNYHIGVYGGTQWGALALRTGLARSRHDIETRRDVAFAGFSDQLKGDYRAGTTQLFGELGYGIETGAFSFEPFANLAYVNLNSRGFAEQGAAAALTGASQTTDVTFTTLGVHAASAFSLGSVEVTAKGMLGWRHAFGDVTPLSTAAFAGSNAFTVAGTPIARNAALIEAGLDLKLSDNASISASYTGQYGSGAQEHGFKAKLGVAF